MTTLETLAMLGPMVPDPPDMDTTRQIMADPVIRCRCLELVGSTESFALRAKVAERFSAGRRLQAGAAAEFGYWFADAVAFAHDPAHEVHPDSGEMVAAVYPQLCFRLVQEDLPDVAVCYSVDRRADGLAVRHASFTLRLVGGWDKATLTLPVDADGETMLSRIETHMAPFVRCLFGDVEDATPSLVTLPPRNVARAGEGIRTETPVVYHVTAPWPIAPEETP